MPTAEHILWAVIGVPAAAALVLAAVPSYRIAALLNVAASLLTLVAAGALFFVDQPAPTSFLLVDDFNIYLTALNTLVGLTTSVFSAGYIEHEVKTGRLTPSMLRFYHALYQIMQGAMNLALLANNLGLLWAGVETATLSTVLMVGAYRTHQAIEAAWKYFLLSGVGIILALFGTTLVYFAAQPAVGEGLDAMSWTVLAGAAPSLDAAMLNLAFVFILVGYGTKAGLVPFHAWLPDAHAEGPTPISAVLSGLLLNVALYAILRFKILLAANGGAFAAGPIMIALGLASASFGALMLYRRRDIKRLFGYSSIEHMGLITFAFGIGGPLANFAGLLHMTLHSLGKSAVFFAVGQIAQVQGTQAIADIRGLGRSHPLLGWCFAISVLAIAGLPPLGLFMSEFLIVGSTFAQIAWLAIPLVLALLVALGALVWRLHGMVFGPSSATGRPPGAGMAPLILHLLLVAIAGVYLPGPLVTWFQRVAAILG